MFCGCLLLFRFLQSDIPLTLYHAVFTMYKSSLHFKAKLDYISAAKKKHLRLDTNNANLLRVKARDMKIPLHHNRFSILFCGLKVYAMCNLLSAFNLNTNLHSIWTDVGDEQSFVYRPTRHSLPTNTLQNKEGSGLLISQNLRLSVVLEYLLLFGR